jgi:hypothetical protein
MPITLSRLGVAGAILPLSRFPAYHARHLAVVANTKALELRGSALMVAGFPFPQLQQFIRDVCIWGGYAGIAGRILKQNTSASICSQFSSAGASFASPSPASTALSALNTLKGLGTPSFASKHLRFMRPDICPVLDSLLSRDLGYPLSVAGYQQFSSDCSFIAGSLNTAGIALPAGARWGAADVEMSIFACLYL